MYKQNKLSIGIFDSGVGGFSVLKEIIKVIPDTPIYYVADNEFAPYGEKSDDEIIERSVFITNKLMEQGVNIVIVACNSATAAAIATLREKFSIPFIGIEPYINIHNQMPGTENERKYSVLTTELTANAQKFIELKKKLDPDCRVAHYTCPGLASDIEQAYQTGMTDELKQKIINDLSHLKNKKYTHAILGCTHYPLIAPLIESELQVDCICPGNNVAKQTRNILQKEGLLDELSSENIIESFDFFSTKDNTWQKRSTTELNLIF
jgi:glutamate racemase